ncbi:MmcQ/YjbR family DNA-binding protein [Nocardioides panacisoli]|uniref:MmcQ/YjbR family DNA-binding protein n=1 Tax=Nocardioides panacisoli TaxID=627624 RepID=UPI001C62DCE4|nr:MmcQ/YjbR family DNA-binding protein [Nocardioides panacisoli]QYJ04157.1 MmcQ/YjbR family DNA-binding protein [Nocardioides panacisoli]
MVNRPDPPEAWVRRVRDLLAGFPQCREEDAWTGVRWRVRGSTVAHLFGGEDQLFRITFRADPDEVIAFRHMGPPYFRVGGNAVGLVLEESTDWEELAELLTDSYCIQAPQRLAALVERPGGAPSPRAGRDAADG